ncbi:RuvC family protein [Pseudomonas frederiksbergensis]|uniref:hypothetical protein n=1 Tax=Pseudomonas frederiksbergensis TaxID=104087 RepID=UPI002DB8B0F3|nr:hypothetical protein [Pseudomonas frederiksbergensis]WRV69728.1 hypothetical protein VQ575_06640 [Pseudomonas frederiksbergensis]
MYSERIFVGIDPGKKGAIAILREDGSLLDLFDMPLERFEKITRVDVIMMAEKLARALVGKIGIVAIEHIHMPANDAIRDFSLDSSYRVALSLAESLGFKVVSVRRQEWKKSLGIKGVDKQRCSELAVRLYPEAKITTGRRNKHGELGVKDGRTNSLLIAISGMHNCK